MWAMIRSPVAFLWALMRQMITWREPLERPTLSASHWALHPADPLRVTFATMRSEAVLMDQWPRMPVRVPLAQATRSRPHLAFSTSEARVLAMALTAASSVQPPLGVGSLAMPWKHAA